MPIALGLAFIVTLSTAVIVWDSQRKTPNHIYSPTRVSELLIQVKPSHASVVVDSGPNQTVGRNGVVIATDANRFLTFSITADGYHPKNVTVKSPDSGRSLVIFELSPILVSAVQVNTKRLPPTIIQRRKKETTRYGVLSVVVRPKQAVAVVDGVKTIRRRGEKLSIGRHSLLVTAPGYASEKRILKINKGMQTIKIRLKPEPPLSISIDLRSEPSGGDVTIDGVSQGRTPLQGLKVPIGKKTRITIAKSGFTTWTQNRSFSNKDVSLIVGVKLLAKARPVESQQRNTVPQIGTKDPIAILAPPVQLPKAVKVTSASVTRMAGATPVLVIPGQNTTATASVNICIDTKGNVSKVQVSELPVLLRKPIAKAVENWQYKIYQSSGIATPACFSEKVRFIIRGR